MLTRREMVQSAMAFSLWPSLRSSAAAALQQIPTEGAADDETFWAYVRSEFELTPEFTSLVSVVRGNFTKTNREIAFTREFTVNSGTILLPLDSSNDEAYSLHKEVANACLCSAPQRRG